MLLVDYVRERYAITHSLVPDSEYQLLRACRILEAWMLRDGSECTVSGPDELMISRWVKWMELLYAPRTVKKYRDDVLTILDDAADCDFRYPIRRRRIRNPTVGPPVAIAWRQEVATKIIIACRQLEGRIKTGIRTAHYMETIYRCTWRVALRRRDWWNRFDFENICDDGRVWIMQGKTRVFVRGQLGSDEIKMLRAIGYRRPLHWPHSGTYFYNLSRKAKKIAGIADLGHLQRFRKSAATDVAKNQGRKAATEFLGHTNPAADAFYIDEMLMGDIPISPTELDLPPWPG